GRLAGAGQAARAGTAPRAGRGGAGAGTAMAGGQGQRPGDRAAAGGGPAPRPPGGGPRGAPTPPRRPARRATRRAGSRWLPGRKPPGTALPARLSLPLVPRLPRTMPARFRARRQSPGRPASLLLLLFHLVTGPALPGAGREAAWCQEPAGRPLRARCGPAMRGRCCCTRSGRGPAPRTCWPRRRAACLPAAARLLAAVSACFALGKATTGQFRHLAAAEAGPLAGLAALPDLRTLRPALA